jgi:hypothetical protein
MNGGIGCALICSPLRLHPAAVFRQKSSRSLSVVIDPLRYSCLRLLFLIHLQFPTSKFQLSYTSANLAFLAIHAGHPCMRQVRPNNSFKPTPLRGAA